MALVKYNNNSISTISSAGQLATGSLVPIKTLTASSSSTLSFVHGSNGVVLDSTYPIYKFEFINIHPATDGAKFQVGFRDGGSNYDATKTTTTFAAQHNEAGSSAQLAYESGNDLGQSTNFQDLTRNTGNANDENCSGKLFLFNPSSTTFVKHFLSETNSYFSNDQSENLYIAGYCNVTVAIDGVQFKFSSGNIDAGTIKLYGIKDS